MSEKRKLDDIENNIANEEAVIEKERERLVKSKVGEELLASRKNKILNWFKDPYNFALVLVMVVATALRLYYFLLTKNQPLWWDELCYGSLARNFITHAWDGTSIIMGETHIRPLFFSFIWAFLMLFHLGEVVNRFLLVLVPSVISVYFIYLIGKEIYDKKIGLISAAIFSVIWLNLFYSSRFLVHMIEMALFLPSLYLFIKAIDNEKFGYKPFACSLILLSLATLTRYQDGLLFLVYFIILIVAKKLNLNKLKFWYSGIIGVFPIILFFLINLVMYGNIFPAIFGGDYLKIGSTGAGTKTPFGFNLLNLIPNFLTTPFFLLFLIGLVYLLFDICLGYNFLAKDAKRRNGLLLILIPLAIFSFFIFILRAAEDRYFFETLASLCIIAAVGLSYLLKLIQPYGKLISIILISIIFLTGSYYELKQADSIINLRKDSYLQMKQAFEWIQENTPEDAVIAGTGIEPYAIYYSNRQYLSFPENYSDIGKVANATYIVAHRFVPQVSYLNDYILKNNATLSVKNIFFADATQTEPMVIIYQKK